MAPGHLDLNQGMMISNINYDYERFMSYFGRKEQTLGLKATLPVRLRNDPSMLLTLR